MWKRGGVQQGDEADEAWSTSELRTLSAVLDGRSEQPLEGDGMQTGAIVALVLFGSLVRVQEEVREQASASAGQARTTEVQVLDETSVAPWAIKQARPKYPKAAFDKKLQGEVVIEFLIDTKGRVAKTRVVQSVPGLDEAAVECLKKWRFKPAVKDGKPVAVIARAPMVFRIF